MSQRGIWYVATVLFLASVMLGVGVQTHAQAVTTADRTNSISLYAMPSHVYTDYGKDDFGYSVGGDFTRHYHWAQPSIDARFTHGDGDLVRESSILGGPKIEKAVLRFHPYGDFLVGYGTIHMPTGIPGYDHDNSIVYAVGGGLDYTVSRHFSVKADTQYQFWKLGSEVHELEPYNISVGVVYRLPFGWKKLPHY